MTDLSSRNAPPGTASPTGDRELLRRYAEEGTEAAFAELVRRHLNLVYRAALRRTNGDAHRAADVSQMVFVALARDAAALARHPLLVGWLYSATRNAAHNAMREEQRRQTREQEAVIMHETTLETAAASLEREADGQQLRPVLDGAMDELSECDRHAVLLRYFEARPFAQVGAALGVGEDAARMRVERALDKLRALLARRGVTSSSAALGASLAGEAAHAAPVGLAASVTGAALAGGGVAVALVGAGIFMNKTLVIVSIVALAAAGSAFYERGVARDARTAAAVIAREREVLRAELRTTRAQVAAAVPQSTPAQPQKAAAVSSAGGPAAAPATKAAEIPAGDLAKARQAMEAAKERLSSLRAEGVRLLSVPENLRSAIMTEEKPWRALYRREGFSAEQIEQFRTVLGRSLRRRMEAGGAGGSANEALEDRLAAEFTVDVKEVFGAPLATSVQRYQDLQPLRAIAERVATNLFYTDSPLTVVQAEQLVDALAGAVVNATGGIEPGRINAEVAAAAVQARNLLSAPQVAELRSVVDAEWRTRPRR